jgi:succinate dehydrogenase/fumarate reductase flavoprotein subunit
MSDKITRREFIKDAAVGAAAVVGAGALAAPAAAQGSLPGVPDKWDYAADLVIVGYGGAGIGAAITAVDAGAKVIVLEKDTVAHGGNTGCSGGTCNVGRTDQGAIDYLTSECWGTVPNAEVIKATALATRALPAWIEKLGGKVAWTNVTPTYPLLPGADAFGGEKGGFGIDAGGGVKGNGYQLFQFFLSVAKAKGIEPMLGTPATDLIQNPNTREILGVKAQKDGKDIFVKASKAVILACGGYENNEEILKNFAPHPHSAMVTWYGTPLNTGDGIKMAIKVGAKLWHMNKKECHSFACAEGSKALKTGIVMTPPYGFPVEKQQSGIIVNRDGKRFMNEYFFTGHTDNHKQYDEFEHKHKPTDDYEYSDYRNVPMFWIFDDATMKGGSFWTESRWVGIHKIYKWSADNEAELAKGWFIKADTIEELAKKIVVKDYFGKVVGMDVAGLVKQVADYNAYCAAGKDAQFNRRAATLKPISKPPYYAMQVIECQTNTQGGPEHDQFARTIGADNKPIPRLYSAGELGSVYGFLYNGGGNVPEAYAMGRVAAQHAVTLKPWDAA